MLNNIKSFDLRSLNSFLNLVNYHNFNFYITDKLYDRIMNEVTVFANNLVDSLDYYKDERLANNALDNIKLGKYGEFAVASMLRKFGFPWLKPDIEIRSQKRKGWRCDLPFSSIASVYPDCHIKMCDQSTTEYIKRYSSRPDQYSWTFQYSNTTSYGGRDPLFFNTKSKELILFGYVDNIRTHEFKLIASGPWHKVQKIIEYPISTKLKAIKRCVYSDKLSVLAETDHAQIIPKVQKLLG